MKNIDMKNSYLFFGLFGLALFATSCDDTPSFVPGEFEEAATLLSESALHSVSYVANQEEVKLIVEDLLNTTDNIMDEFPALDFLAIKVDVNNNNLPDDNLDKSYSISSANVPCTQFVLENGTASTGCIQEEGYSYEARYSSSDKSDEPHIIYELTIRQEYLFAVSDKVGLIFIMSGDDSAGSVPSFLSPVFKETIEFSL